MGVIFFFAILFYAVTGSTDTLTWDVTPSTTYNVYIRDAGKTDSDYKILASNAKSPLTLKTEVHNKNYEYSVKAVNECGNESVYSDPIPYNACVSQFLPKVTGVRITITIIQPSTAQK